MLGQSLGSMVVAFSGLRAFCPDIFLDTTGCAFTYFVAKVLAGRKVATYTHYPTITSVRLPLCVPRAPVAGVWHVPHVLSVCVPSPPSHSLTPLRTC